MTVPTNKELITGVDHKLDLFLHDFSAYKEAEAERNKNIQEILNKLANTVEKHDERIKTNENCLGKKSVKIDNLEKRVNSWSLMNSFGVVIATILGFFGINRGP